MKRKILILITVFFFAFTIGANALYFPDEVTDQMIEELAEEAHQYRDDSSLQLPDTGHSVVKSLSGIGGVSNGILSFRSVSRQIMEQAHAAHRQYKEPDIEELKKIVNNENYLKIDQMAVVQERELRNPDDMHLVFRIIENDEEKIIQPENTISSNSTYSSPLHIGMKSYHFSYDDFPTRQEYLDNDINIFAILISRNSETEVEIPWTEIR